MVAAGKVGAAYRTGKKAIANKDLFLVLFDKYDMAASVPGAVVNIENKLADLILFAMFPVACKPRRLGIFKPESSKLHLRQSHHTRLKWKPIVKILIVLVKDHLGIGKFVLQKFRPADVIQVAMRKCNSLQFPTTFPYKLNHFC